MTDPTTDAVRRAIEAADGCPDCTAEREITEEAPGILHLWVRHEATCPTYLALQARGLTG